MAQLAVGDGVESVDLLLFVAGRAQEAADGGVGVVAVVDREPWVDAEPFGVGAQEVGAEGVERAGVDHVCSGFGLGLGLLV